MKFDIKNILIFALAIGMTSCVETMKDGDLSTGYLGVPVLETDIQVEEFGATKAAPALPTLSVPDASTLHFKVTGADNVVKWNQDGLWSSALQMPVGDYTIEVNYGSNTFGAPYYTGTCTGTISAVTEAVPAIGLRLCNSLLAVVLADDFTQHFIPSEGNCVTITSTSGSTSTTLGNYVFVPSGENLTIQVAGKSSTNENKTLSWTLSQLSAATATFVTCSLTTTNAPAITMREIPVADAWGNTAYVPLATTANISEANVAKMEYYASSDNWATSVKGTIVDGSVKFTGLTPGATYKVRAQIGALKSNDEVSMTMSTSALSIKTAAAHTKNTSNELDGTDFTATFSVLDKFGVTAASLSLCKTDGTVLRTATLSGTTADWTSDGSTLTGAGTWPFLPGGNYSLKGTATQNGSTVTLAELPITVPATPDFTVSVTGKTSYSVYCDTNNPNRVSDANLMNAETISDIGTTVNIAENLRNNSNYGYGVQYLYDENPATLTGNSITGCSWASHELKSKVTFANKEITSAITCHITGLPYRAPSETAFNASGKTWSKIQGSNAAFEISSTKVHLESAANSIPKASSPKFSITNSIKVTITGQYFKSSGGSSYKFSIKAFNGSNEGSELISQTPSGKGNTDPFSCNHTFTSDMPQIIAIYNYGWGANYVDITSMNIEYSN